MDPTEDTTVTDSSVRVPTPVESFNVTLITAFGVVEAVAATEES